MTTLFVGDFGHGLMAAEAALQAAVQAFNDADSIAVTATAAFTARCVPGLTCIGAGEPLPRPAGRVVLVGPVGYLRRVPPLIDAFRAAVAGGAAPVVHNLTLPPGLLPGAYARVAQALGDATGSIRDHITLLNLMQAGLPWFPLLATYPERGLRPDDSLAALLPEGPAPVALMLDGYPQMLAALDRHPEAFRSLLAHHPDRPVLAIPIAARGLTDASMPDPPTALRQALLRFRGGQPPLLPPLLDPGWWLAHATPAGIAGLVRRCAAVLTTADLGVAFAAGAGLPCHVIGITMDDPATRAAGTLAAALAPGSSFVVLR